jgi:hypothetical protein
MVGEVLLGLKALSNILVAFVTLMGIIRLLLILGRWIWLLV